MQKKSKLHIFLRFFLITLLCVSHSACMSKKSSSGSSRQTAPAANVSQNSISLNPRSSNASAFHMEMYLPEENLTDNNHSVDACAGSAYSVTFTEGQVQDVSVYIIHSTSDGIRVTAEDGNDNILDLSKFSSDTPGRYLILESGVDYTGTLDSNIILCSASSQELCGDAAVLGPDGNCWLDYLNTGNRENHDGEWIYSQWAATQYCNELEHYSGRTDWEAPTKDELLFLGDTIGWGDANFVSYGFTGYNPDLYWTSSSYDTTQGWAVDFRNGTPVLSDKESSTMHYEICVARNS